MSDKLTWSDADEIAESLYESYPETDPLNVSFPRLHQMITGLDNFGDDPNGSTEHILEVIQMAWYEML